MTWAWPDDSRRRMRLTPRTTVPGPPGKYTSRLALVWLGPASVDGANYPPSPGDGWESGMYPRDFDAPGNSLLARDVTRQTGAGDRGAINKDLTTRKIVCNTSA